MTIREIRKPGFRYRTNFEPPEPNITEAFKKLMDQTGCLTGNVGDCLDRGAGMTSLIKGLPYGMKVIGPALTIRVAPENNLMIHKDGPP